MVSQNMLRSCAGKQIILNFKCSTTSGVSKWFNLIKLSNFLHNLSSISELPSNKSTMEDDSELINREDKSDGEKFG